MRRRRGFTLIELMAVVALLALVSALVIPTFDLGGGRAVRREAEQVGDAVEFARQRAIMTGRAHRVVLDLEGGRHHVEWAPRPERAPGGGVKGAAARRVALVPPPEASGRLEFIPVPGPFGRDHRLDGDVIFLDVALPDARLDRGEVWLELGADGAADPAVIALSDPERGRVVEVEVRALADAVQVIDAQR